MSTKSSLRFLVAAFLLVAASCGGGTSARNDIPDAIQTEVVSDGFEAEEDGLQETLEETVDADVVQPGDADVTEDVPTDTPTEAEIDVPPLPPEVTYQFLAADGPKGLGEAEVLLVKADEPPAYVDSPGFQIDIAVATLNLENGRDVQLAIAGAVVATSKVVTDMTGSGSVLFENVTFTHNPAGYDVTVSATNVANLTGAETKKVRVDIGTCGVDFTPKNGSCVLADGNPDLPGVQVTFAITNPDRTCDQATLTYTVDGVAQSIGPVALDASGAATLEVTLLPSADGVDGVPVDVVVTVADSKAPDRTADTPSLTYVIDLIDPVVSIVQPDKATLTLQDDRDGDPTNGINIDVAGTSAGEEPGGLVTLELNGTIPAAYPPTAPDAGGAWLFPNLPIVENGKNTLRAWSKDACGRIGAAELALQATVVQTTYSFEFPAQGALLAAKDDGTPATKMVYDSTFVVLADPFQPGTTLSIYCRNQKFGSASFLAGSLRFDEASADGRYAIPVSIDVSATTPKVACQVRDDAVNPGTSADVSFVAALPAPVLRVLAPKANAQLSKPSLPVALYATGLDGVKPHARIVDATGSDVVTFDAPKGIAQQSASFTVPLENGGVAIADGAYTLAIDATDAQGNVAADIAGNVTSVPFVLDTTAPTVEITTPDHDVLDPALNDSDVDQLPEVPGYQTTVTVTVVAGGGNGTQVCLSVNGEAAQCSVVATGESAVSFPEITLIPGDNTLEAWATDASKNAGLHVTRTVNLVLTGPRVTIVTPAKDGPIVTLPFDLVAQVTDAAKAPIAGAEVTLLRNGVEGADKVVTGADGKATFAISELSESGDKFVARAVVDAQESFSPTRKLYLKTSLPALAFDVPADQDVVNLAYPACTPGSKACVLDVLVDAINFVEGSSGTLTVVCGTSTKTYPGLVAGMSLVFPDVSLTDQSTCTLSVQAIDVSSQTAAAGPISVRVDRVAPRAPSFVGILASYDYNFDEDPATPGLQKSLTLALGGVEAGRVANITWGVTGSVEAPQTTTFTVPDAIADNASRSFVLPAMTLPNGTVKLTVTIDDLAANVATSDTYVDVWVDKPSVRMFQPAFVDAVSCTAASQCGAGGCYAGKCALAWGIASVRSLSVIVEKAPLQASNLRICTNAAGVTGAACATSGGFKQVAITTTTASSTTMTVPLSGLPQGHQSFVAELKGLDGSWYSSMSAAASGDRVRNIFVDTVAPVVNAIASPSDTLPPVGMLNAAEQKAPGRVFEIRVQASEAGSLSIEQSGKSLYTLPTFTGDATVDMTLSEGANELYAVVSDVVGNRSYIWNSASLLFYRPTVDTILPTLSFLAPGAQVKAGDNADVSLRSDAVGRTVTLSEAGVELAHTTVAAGQIALFPDATFGLLTNGSHAFDAAVTDAAGNPASARLEVLVDREAPAVAVFKPVANDVYTDTDDAQAGVSGFQIEVSFGTVSTDALSWRVEVAADCDAGFEFCGEPTPVASGAVSSIGGIEPSVFPTLGVTSSPYYLAIVKVFDPIGNVGWQTIPFTLDLKDCTVGLSGFVPNGWINNSACPVSGQDCASIAREITVSASAACGPVTKARLFQQGGATLVEDFAGQIATFPMSFADGASPSLEGRAYVGDTQVGTSGSQAFKVDLSSPKVLILKPASADNRFGVAADGNTGAPGLQADLQVSVSDANLADGGSLVSASWTDTKSTTMLAPTNVVLPFTLTASPATVDLLDVTIPDDSIGTASILAKDAAGNFGSATFAAAVDVTAPAPVDLATVTIDNARLPVVTLSWSAPGDDGTAAGTRAASYEIRYSKYPITEDNFDSACTLDALAASDAVPAPADAGTAQTLVIRGPDTRDPKANTACSLATNMPGAATYSVAIRAVDELGNRSSLGAASVESMDIGLRVLNVVGTTPYDDASFQRRVFRVGDLDHDGFQDLGLGGGSRDIVCIVRGWDVQGASSLTDYTLDAASGAHHQCLTGVANNLGLPIVYLGDVNGDGVDDLGVGEGKRPVDGGVPRMKIYLGVAGGSLPSSPNVTIVGMNNAPLAGIVAAGGGNFNGDTVADRPINDILIGSKAENKAYIVPGSASWTSSTNLTIDLTQAADRTANNVVTIALTGGTSFTQFGTNATFVKDVGSDGRDEVALSTNYGAMWGGTVSVAGQIVVVRGRDVPAAMTITLSNDNTKDPTNGTDDNTAARLSTTSIVASLGNSALGGLFDLDGDGKGDVVAGHTPYAAVNLEQTVVGFYGAAIDQSWGAGIRQVGALAGDTFYRSAQGFYITGAYAIPTPIGNFNDDPDGGVDLAYGMYSASLNMGKVFVRFNQKAADGGAGPYPFESSVLADPLDPTGVKFGMALAPVGDFNGDGLPDFAIATNAGAHATLVY